MIENANQAEEQEIEISVEDDAVVENQASQDDELENYTKSVSKRINKLNESRDARIAALKYSSSDPVHEVYRADRGEAKARAVQARRALTPEQRANSLVTDKDTGVPDWLTYSSNEYK